MTLKETLEEEIKLMEETERKWNRPFLSQMPAFKEFLSSALRKAVSAHWEAVKLEKMDEVVYGRREVVAWNQALGQLEARHKDFLAK